MTAIQAQVKVSTLAGTPKEVQAQLVKTRAERVLVVAFDQIDPAAFQTVAENFSNLATAMFNVLQERHERESLERLAEILTPRTPVSPRLLREAAMLVRARKDVLESGDLLSATQVAQLAGLSDRNPSAQPNKWKKQGQIFAIQHNGVDYFPGYGLDRDAAFRPLKALAKIIEIFAGHKKGWGMAYWFRSPCSYLGSKRPQDLLATQAERVIEAARKEVQVIDHG